MGHDASSVNADRNPTGKEWDAKMFTNRRTALVFLAALSCAGASAASFDCGKAKRPMERAICSNPKLSELDGRMAQVYQEALGLLSARGATALKTSQLSWLHYANLVCSLRAEGNALREVDGACLEREMDQRIVSLQEAGVRLGVFVLTRVDRYDAFPNEPGDDSGGHNGMVVRHVGYPQIDGVGTAAKDWNASQVKVLPAEKPEERDSTDYDADYEIGCANQDLLSVAQLAYQYPHGAAHGSFASTALTIVFKPEIHFLEADDLFSQESDWESKLPNLFWEAYLGDPDAIRDDELVEAVIRDAAADVERWVLTPRGLRIGFSAYEAGSYATTPRPITVSWKALRPLLTNKRSPKCLFSSIR